MGHNNSYYFHTWFDLSRFHFIKILFNLYQNPITWNPTIVRHRIVFNFICMYFVFLLNFDLFFIRVISSKAYLTIQHKHCSIVKEFQNTVVMNQTVLGTIWKEKVIPMGIRHLLSSSLMDFKVAINLTQILYSSMYLVYEFLICYNLDSSL